MDDHMIGSPAASASGRPVLLRLEPALRCTAAAGGGIPWLTSLSRASQLDEITAVEGILNGTTNYMLSAMTNSGADYAPAHLEKTPNRLDPARRSCTLPPMQDPRPGPSPSARHGFETA